MVFDKCLLVLEERYTLKVFSGEAGKVASRQDLQNDA